MVQFSASSNFACFTEFTVKDFLKETVCWFVSQEFHGEENTFLSKKSG